MSTILTIITLNPLTWIATGYIIHKLRKPKPKPINQLNRLWRCDYCNAPNLQASLKCQNCNAPRKEKKQK